MAETSYRVGQVLYIVPAENAVIVPVRVTERRISETEQGTVMTHIIKSPSSKKPPLKLESVKGMVFSDLARARAIMLSNATRAIDGMIQHAQSVAQSAFGVGGPPKAVVLAQEPDDGVDSFFDDVMPPNGVSMQDDQQVYDDDMGPVAEVMGPEGTVSRVKLIVD